MTSILSMHVVSFYYCKIIWSYPFYNIYIIVLHNCFRWQFRLWYWANSSSWSTLLYESTTHEPNPLWWPYMNCDYRNVVIPLFDYVFQSILVQTGCCTTVKWVFLPAKFHPVRSVYLWSENRYWSWM